MVVYGMIINSHGHGILRSHKPYWNNLEPVRAVMDCPVELFRYEEGAESLTAKMEHE